MNSLFTMDLSVDELPDLESRINFTRLCSWRSGTGSEKAIIRQATLWECNRLFALVAPVAMDGSISCENNSYSFRFDISQGVAHNAVQGELNE